MDYYDSRLPIQQNLIFNFATSGKFLNSPFTPKIDPKILKTAEGILFFFLGYENLGTYYCLLKTLFDWQ